MSNSKAPLHNHSGVASQPLLFGDVTCRDPTGPLRHVEKNACGEFSHCRSSCAQSVLSVMLKVLVTANNDNKCSASPFGLVLCVAHLSLFFSNLSRPQFLKCPSDNEGIICDLVSDRAHGNIPPARKRCHVLKLHPLSLLPCATGHECRLRLHENTANARGRGPKPLAALDMNMRLPSRQCQERLLWALHTVVLALLGQRPSGPASLIPLGRGRHGALGSLVTLGPQQVHRDTPCCTIQPAVNSTVPGHFQGRTIGLLSATLPKQTSDPQGCSKSSHKG